MPVLTFHGTNATLSPHQEMADTQDVAPGANATSAPQMGWVVGTGSTNHSELDSATNRASTTFTGTTVPDGTLDTTLGDAFRSNHTYSGSFATGVWTFTFSVIGVTQSGAQGGNIRIRLLRGTAADGTGATEFSGGSHVIGTSVTSLSTTQQDSTATTGSITGFSVANEYIFVQAAWQRVVAGGMTSTDVAIRYGSTATRLVTPVFTPTPDSLRTFTPSPSLLLI